MEWDGKVEASKLACSVSNEPLAPGALFYSALLFQGGLFVRRDFSAEAWDGVDRSAYLAWWREKAPRPDDGPRFKPIDREALLRIFHALKSDTDRPKQCFLYVVALFLMRARKFRYIDIGSDADGTYLLVEDKALKTVYRVRDPGMNADEERAVQSNLMDVVMLGETVADEAAENVPSSE